ncbi:MAG: nucleotidyltransferase domain-containing protein [Coriobacteriales bacterium]|nr:nucleotidyltransferase domain-containing protein [Coriobacteriales bacterium]
MNDVLQKIHPSKHDFVRKMLASDVLKENCEEVWIFGSAVNGATPYPHTEESDIDIAIKTGTRDLTSKKVLSIGDEIADISISLNYQIYDMIWIDLISNDFIKEVYKGVSLFK